jgi:hypothetical protein
MKRLQVAAAVIGGILLAGASGAQAQAGSAQSSLKDLLLSRENAVAAAEKNKDAHAIEQQVAEDFVGIGTNGQTSGRGDLLDSLNEVTLQEYTIYNAEALALNDGAAVLSYDAIVRVAGGDSMVPRYQRVSSVWVNRGGAWKLAFQQATAKKWGD